MFNSKISNISGAFFMAFFGVVALWRFQETSLLFFLLFAMRDFIASYFFVVRKESLQEANLNQSMMAYVSAILTLFYQTGTNSLPHEVLVAQVLTIIGFTFVTWATLDLGTSIAIAPAKREFVNTGIYKYLSHPMYLGYFIAESGFLLLNFDNTIIFVTSIMLYIKRSSFESKIIEIHYLK